jgi:DNA-binding NarL/FixJ family response regulator
MTRILLADDHVVVRQGLQRLLSEQPDFTVVGEAGDGATALRLAAELQPDVLLLDLVMPGLNGLAILEDMRRCSPQTRIVVLSMHDNSGYVLRALRGGVLAYVLKESSDRELLVAIRFALQGRHYLSASLVEHVVAAFLQGPSPAPVVRTKPPSKREREVLRLLGVGRTNTEIAAALGVDTDTVGTYCRRLRDKLGLHSQTELRQYAREQHDAPSHT